MIDILNGYGFKRNFQNTVVYPITDLGSLLGLQPHEIKEHYFLCVLDDCLAQGEYHTEEVVNGNIEVYLPAYNAKYLIDSLIREGFKIDEFQSKNIIEKLLETQTIVSECFDMKSGSPSYSDPIRKHNLPFVKDIGESISRHPVEEFDFSESKDDVTINT